MTRSIAYFFSCVFHPLLMPFYGVLILFSIHPYYSYRFQGSLKYKLLGIILLSTFMLPALFTVMIKKAGLVNSLSMDESRERRLPFVVTGVFYAFAYFLLQRVQPGSMLSAYLLASSACVVLATIFNFFFKVSVHAIGLGGLGALLLLVPNVGWVDLRLLLMVFLLLAGITASSRLFLGAHKPSEIYTGFLSGLLLTYVIMKSGYV